MSDPVYTWPLVMGLVRAAGATGLRISVTAVRDDGVERRAKLVCNPQEHGDARLAQRLLQEIAVAAESLARAT